MTLGAHIHAFSFKQRPEIRSMRFVATHAHHLFIPSQWEIRRKASIAAAPLGSFGGIKGVGRVIRMAAGAKVVDIIYQLSPVVGSMGTVACGTVL